MAAGVCVDVEIGLGYGDCNGVNGELIAVPPKGGRSPR
jgi:hypothetical protein